MDNTHLTWIDLWMVDVRCPGNGETNEDWIGFWMGEDGEGADVNRPAPRKFRKMGGEISEERTKGKKFR